MQSPDHESMPAPYQFETTRLDPQLPRRPGDASPKKLASHASPNFRPAANVPVSPRLLRAAWSGCCRRTIGCLSRSPRAILRLGMGDNVVHGGCRQGRSFPDHHCTGQPSGQPCVRGLRITAWDGLDMLASGMTEDEILRDYPYLEKADFPAVYAYASQSGRERKSR